MFDFGLQVIAPVALCVGSGYFLGRVRGISAQPLAQAGVDVFGPALLLANIPYGLASDPLIVIILLGTVAGTWFLATLWANVIGLQDRDQRTGLILGATLCNFGFFGLPIVESALGPAAFPAAMAVMVILNIPTGLMSAYFASPKPDVRSALKFTFATPFNWAVLAALVLVVTGVRLPEPVLPPLSLLAQAAIPVGLGVLGIELSRIRLRHISASILLAALSLRLVVAPLLVIVLCVVIGFDQDKVLAQSAVLQMATPAGITPLIFMASVGRNTGALAAVVFWSTIVSMLTIPLVAIVVAL